MAELVEIRWIVWSLASLVRVWVSKSYTLNPWKAAEGDCCTTYDSVPMRLGVLQYSTPHKVGNRIKAK